MSLNEYSTSLKEYEKSWTGSGETEVSFEELYESQN